MAANKKIVVDGVTVEYIVMDPATAKDILENNTNRSLRPHRVNEYAKAMKSGDWTFNGDAVRLDKNGSLRDGQHRLEACVQSGQKFPCLLVTGLEPKAQSTMDTGSRRTVADTLELEGYDNAKLLAASLNIVNFWETQGILLRQPVGAILPSGAVSIAQRHPDIAKFIKMVREDKLRHAPAPSTYIASLYIIHQATRGDEDSEKQFSLFLDGMFRGLGFTSQYDPRLVLRNRFKRIQEGEPGRNELVAAQVGWLTLRAWNAFKADEQINKYQIGSGPNFTFNKSEFWPQVEGDKIRLSQNTLPAAKKSNVTSIKKKSAA